MSNPIARWFSSLSQGGAQQMLRRFYIPILQVVAVVCLLCWAIADLDAKYVSWWAIAVYYFGAGAVLSWGLRMFSEGRGRLGLIVSVVAQALWLGNAVYLYYKFEDLSLPTMLGNASVLFFIAVASLIAPTLGTRTELPTWRYTLRTLGSILLSSLLTSLVVGGVAILLLMLDYLLGIVVPDRLYAYLSASVGPLLFTYLFLAQQPSAEQVVQERLYTINILTIFARYLLAPLLGLYLVVLYVYALRILILWELPEGMVSVPVSISLALMLLLVSLLYPIRQTEEVNRYDELLCRWLPLLVMPLLLLMSVGLYKRWSDYGMTIMRLYLLVANVWCYFACIYLYLHRSQRLRILPLSLSLLFLFTSIGPWSFASITHRYMRSSLEGILSGVEHKPGLPMSEEDLNSFLDSLPTQERNRFVRHLKYLDDTYSSESVEDIVDESVWVYGLDEDILVQSVDELDEIIGYDSWQVEEPDSLQSLPAGFTSFYIDEFYFDVYEPALQNGQFLEEADGLGLSVRITVDELKAWAEAETYRPHLFSTTDPKVFYYATSMNVNVYRDNEGKVSNVDGNLKGIYVSK